MAGFGTVLFFIDLIVGLYLINLGIPFVSGITLPSPLNNYTIALGGGLLILGGLMAMMSMRRPIGYRR
jgi:hypothetical protein